jgi:hypothetical protein
MSRREAAEAAVEQVRRTLEERRYQPVLGTED